MTPGRRSKPGTAAAAFRFLCRFGLAALIGAAPLPAFADSIANPVASFSGLDKITASVTKFDVYINETVQFGSLQIMPRVCYTRPTDETQRTSVFVEIDQVSLSGGSKRIFTGWMFADSPALNPVDDAVYDVWLVDCKQRSDVPPPAANAAPPPAATTPAAKPPAKAAAQPASAAAPRAGTGGSGREARTCRTGRDDERVDHDAGFSPSPTADTSP